MFVTNNKLLQLKHKQYIIYWFKIIWFYLVKP